MVLKWQPLEPVVELIVQPGVGYRMKPIEETQSDLSEVKDTPPLLSVVDTVDPAVALKNLVSLVANEERPYEEVAEQIEDRSYELCDGGCLDQVIEQLNRCTCYFESLGDKNDEQCRDLSDLYLLIGQVHQFTELFAESIMWFNKAAIVDDRYATPFHSMALSYMQLHKTDSAIKCFEQELELSPGNYYTYLLLADLYEQEGLPQEVEECLKELMERDPTNLQGLHSLIKHYEKSDTAINTTLLIRRLTKVKKKLSRVEVVLKSYYLCRERRHEEVLACIDNWNSGGGVVTITDLIKAHVCNELRQFNKSHKSIQTFKIRNHGRMDIMLGKLKEFKELFGEAAAEGLQKMLLFSPSKK